ncbi:MAG: UPF0149 family protein [Burkholderiales bacterium]
MNEQLPLDLNAADAPPHRIVELELILDDLRTRWDETPEWEFCEGFMAALLCTRRVIEADEYLPMLFGSAEQRGFGPEEIASPFADPRQQQRFEELWHERLSEVVAALEADVETLADERSYEPDLFDSRALIAQLPEHEREGVDPRDEPALGELWALGFLTVAEFWPDEWQPPRDREMRKVVQEAMATIEVLLEDDTAPPDVSPYDEADPPSVSRARLDALGAALWAVYDLYDVWHSLGPRIAPARKADTPGRNDPCPCGSGKKFKKCHGA